MASKFNVGDKVELNAEVLAVHPQGFKYGLHPNGAPNLPPHANPTEAELLEAKTEQPDVLEVAVETSSGKTRFFVSADQLG